MRQSYRFQIVGKILQLAVQFTGYLKNLSTNLHGKSDAYILRRAIPSDPGHLIHINNR